MTREDERRLKDWLKYHTGGKLVTYNFDNIINHCSECVDTFIPEDWVFEDYWWHGPDFADWWFENLATAEDEALKDFYIANKRKLFNSWEGRGAIVNFLAKRSRSRGIKIFCSPNGDDVVKFR